MVPAETIRKQQLIMNISKMNIVIGDVQVMTLGDLITDVLRQVPYVEDIVESSPTLEAFIEVLPQLVFNVVLFVLTFFIFKWFSMIIYWVIAAIFFSKKKTAGKDKQNFIGAVLGGVQGLIILIRVLNILVHQKNSFAFQISFLLNITFINFFTNFFRNFIFN